MHTLFSNKILTNTENQYYVLAYLINIKENE